jgi:OFA family oxalate/formate antiporter-like MFS transporter
LIQPYVSHRLPFFYGWVIVGIAVLIAPFFGSLTSWGLGVLVVPMEEELEWSRSVLFAPLAVGAMVSAVLGILLGPLLDRKRGPMLLFGSGVLLFGVSAISLRYIDSLWTYFLFFGVVGGAGRYGVQVIFTIVPKWFVRKRGMSQAVIGAGFSLGPLVFPVLLQSLIDNIGWRDTWLVMGALLLATSLPVALLVARAPEDVGSLPDGRRPDIPESTSTATGAIEATEGVTRGEAVRGTQLWIIIAAVSLATFAIRGLIPNLHPFFVSEGMAASTAAFSFSAYAVVAFFTVFFWGALADRIGARLPFILVIGFCLAAVAILTVVSSVWLMFLGMVVLATGLNGFFNLWQVVLVDAFGRQHIGAIRGVADAFISTAIFVGPVAFGLLFDLTSDYFWLFATAVVLWAISLVLAVLVQRPRVVE